MNFNNFFNWFRKPKNNEVEALAKIVIKGRPQSRTTNSKANKVYLYDASTPDLIIDQGIPSSMPLNVRSVGEQGGGYGMGSIQQQAMALKQIVHDSLTFLISKTPKKITSWSAVQALMLMARAGKDANAYYDRTSLKFFFFGDPVRKKNIFTCDSRSIVAHEFGHAYLDILRPDWWDIQSVEVWAFHEAFGDIVALLSALQHDRLIDRAIIETGNDLSKSNILSRLAGDMGIGLNNLKYDCPANCLRDMTHRFNYTPPEELPNEGADNILTNESHSFARVFSGAFYDALLQIAIAHINKGFVLRDGMKQARDIMARYMLSAVCKTPTAVRLYDALAKQMIQADIAEGGKYEEILRGVFASRKIINPGITMLQDTNMEDFISEINEPYEIQTNGKNKIVRTISSKKIKLTDKLGVMALNNNPLLDLEITIPDESAYFFDDQSKLVDIISSNEAEIVDSAFRCLTYLNDNNLVGKHETATFTISQGKLVRKQISCRCNKPNYCDPNAPEYGKPWKPKNNAGCVSCKSNCEPMSCECESPAPNPPPKQGCYTRLVAGMKSVYATGSRISRKVC